MTSESETLITERRELRLSEQSPVFWSNCSRARHGWYEFKEGFAADLVRDFVGNHGCNVIDPFCGSGTTIVESAACGGDAVGVEVNPFVSLLARAKSERVYDVRRFDESVDYLLSGRQRAKSFRLTHESTLVERKGLSQWLFNASVAKRFEDLASRIELLPSPKYRRLLKVVLIWAMKHCCNAKKDGKGLRYRSDWRARAFVAADLDREVHRLLKRVRSDLVELPRLTGRTRVINGDCRRVLPAMATNDDFRFDALLTSPPYLNSFDYTDIYRPELLLMGSYHSSSDLRPIRLRTLRSHVQVEWPGSPMSSLASVQRLVEAISAGRLWHRRISEMIHAYFVDLESVFAAALRLLRRGAPVGVVIAQSAYAGHVVPCDVIAAEVLNQCGFEVDGIETLRVLKGNGNHQLREGAWMVESLVRARRP